MEEQLEQSINATKVSNGSRRSGRSVRTHRAVMTAAAQLLAENGYASVTIEGIAARASVAKTTIYRWWSTKAAIFMELYNEVAAEMLTGLDTGSVEQDLRNLLLGLFKLFTTTSAGPAMVGMIAEAQSSPEFAKVFQEQFMAHRRNVTRKILERGVERGELQADLSIDLAIDVISGPIWYRLLQGHAPLDEHFADGVVRQVLFGIWAK
jgi:AcrR family transcriptional regulator